MAEQIVTTAKAYLTGHSKVVVIPSYIATVHIIQSKSARKHSNKESDNHIVQIVLLMLIPLVIVLVWIALMYDKLLTNPFLAILLVLGVLVILFGGTICFGPIKIQSKR